ncbi:methyltransferase domain-containing protein [Prochlorococcus sp. MIT 1341]|uniref:methyltransferase domain-containing protein n=1 Tax=Prochlorococcus sp. MIT 1341 TaxID=3096221 RepID=UPI002A74AF15|nr:methyltransferase domain-containing protein [Prochlorococcus sp. MIT 1341]
MKQLWHQEVIENFDKAAISYNENAKLQIAIAWRLAKICTRNKMPKGLWVDLGAGTGLLADALEELNPAQQVLRIDGSNEMLSRTKRLSHTRLWDLSEGLPNLETLPSLLASSFTLHWLEDPPRKLNEWFYSLASGGFLALAVPVDGSFPEWYQASNNAKVPCTALPLPNPKSLLNEIPKHCIQYRKIHSFTQYANDAPSLLKTMRRVGGQTSKNKPLSIKEWRRLSNSWKRSLEKKCALTWRIQIIILKR